MRRKVLQVFGITLLGAATVLFFQGWKAFGKRAQYERLERMRLSRQWHTNHFENPEPLQNDMVGALGAMTSKSKFAAPETWSFSKENASRALQQPAQTGLRVVWFGHSSTLVEIDGLRVLTDPMFSERASPIGWLGPRRWYAPPIAFSELPEIDAVVISHDHYDHLDMQTVQKLIGTRAIFVVPLGMGAHLEYWGVPAERIAELDWWQEKTFGPGAPLRIVVTPARHASGRMLVDNNSKLWAGFALITKRHRVYYSGDTGLFNAMKEIGRRLGPFDLTMIEVGQYSRFWPDWHIGPEQAVAAHRWVRGRVFLPVHWGLFVLAMHSWTEPVERAMAEANRLGVTIVTPRPGEIIEPAMSKTNRWWPKIPWQSAKQHPVISTQVNR